MYEYKVVTSLVNEAEKIMNDLAKENWKVITVSPNIAIGHGLVITFERKKKDE